ncbi:MAG: ankyrin repeat domain-containing protein [Caldilineaceae bacterium]|nr:ankyrin repeat domain-containing protein [Caldilineaceae bacterium]
MSTLAPSPAEEIREFVIAGHGNLDKVKEMLSESPNLLNRSHEWAPNDTETALQAAAHVGNRDIAEYLLAQGAPLDICTAAMLGRQEDVQRLLQKEKTLINATGAHGIPLMAHVALSGNADLAQLLAQNGAKTGMSMALSNAVSKGHLEMTRWLLENGAPDIEWQNFQGKTALQIATEQGNAEIAELLRAYSAA